MARIRSIHPGMHTDEAIMQLSGLARYFLIGIWGESDDQGIFEWKPIVLKARIVPADAVTGEQLLDELVAQNCVRRFEVNGKAYGAVRNFQKFQRPKKPNAIYPMPDDISIYVGALTTGSEVVGNQFGTGGEIPQQMEDGGWREGRNKEDNPPAAALNPVARDAAAAMAEGAQGNPWTPILEAFAEGCVDGGGVRTFSGSPDDRLCAKRLLEAGAKPDLVRFVTSAITERQKARGKAQPSTIRYVERAVLDAVAQPPPDMPRSQADTEDNARTLRALRLRGLIDKGLWQDHWGPRPTIDDAEAELRGERKAA